MSTPTRRLVLMRHATADQGTGDDARRRLERRGLREARDVGARLARLGLAPDLVLCSTATRCRETWEELSKGFSNPVEVRFEASLYNASTQHLLDAIAGIANEEAETLLVLAHNPGIGQLARALAGAAPVEDRSPLRGGFSPASTAVFEVSGSWAEASPRGSTLLRAERPPDD